MDFLDDDSFVDPFEMELGIPGQDPLSWFNNLISPRDADTDALVSLKSVDASLEPSSVQPSPSENEGSSSPPSSLRSPSGSAVDTDSPQHSTRRPKIQLAPDQPLTAAGKPRARVYVACHGCRSRKIRCDGAKPVCYNCRCRDPETVACNFDEEPKRRGQDKMPGTRIRSAVGSQKSRYEPRRRAWAQAGVGGGDSMRDGHTKDIVSSFDPWSFDPNDPGSYTLPSPPPLPPAMDAKHQLEDDAPAASFYAEPGMDFTRETWWDAVLQFYAAEGEGRRTQLSLFTAEQRNDCTKRVFVDIRYFLRHTVYWANFIHVPRLFEILFHSDRRMSLQPGLILSMLALGTFFQSSELRLGAGGRARAMKLAELAHSAVQASLATQWIDIGLVQAAWLLTWFEMQAHPAQTRNKSHSAFMLLDSLIQLFALTTLDVDLPDSRFSLFAMQTNSLPATHVPSEFVLGIEYVERLEAYAHPLLNDSPSSPPASVATGGGCNCAHFTLKQQWPGVLDVAPLLEATPMWPDALTEGEMRKEECRRLAWSSMMLAAGHTSFKSASAGVERLDLYIKHHDNYALLLPGDTLARVGMPIGQNNIWALYLRAMLLWHTGLRIRSNANLPYADRVQFAIDSWVETDAVEAALNQHTCNLEGRMAHQAREFLFNARMCISLDFQRYLPHVSSCVTAPAIALPQPLMRRCHFRGGSSPLYREKCEAWLNCQITTTTARWDYIQNKPKGELGERSFLLYWFLGHVTRSLALWENDPSLMLAIDAAKVFVAPLEYLMHLWPCQETRGLWEVLRARLVGICLRAGVEPPTPALPFPHPEADNLIPLPVLS